MPLPIEQVEIVDEHHVFCVVQIHRTSLIALVTFDKKEYFLQDVFHTQTGLCPCCKREVQEHTPCYYFSLHEQDAYAIEQTLTEQFPLQLTKQTNGSTFPFNYAKSSTAKNHVEQVIQLNEVAIKRKETIQRYDALFTFYQTKIDGKVAYITLAGERLKRKPPRALLLDKELVDACMAVAFPIQDPLQEAEYAIVQTYNVSQTKWSKMTQLLGAMKKSILLYTSVYERFSSPYFQELIVCLHELLYREIPLRGVNPENFSETHEKIAAILQLYMINQNSFHQCMSQLVKKPHDYLAERKERVLFTIRALFVTKDVYRHLKDMKIEGVDEWHDAICTLLLTYLKIECGIAYQPRDVQQEVEDFLFEGFKQVENGVWTQQQLVYELDKHAPFLFEAPYEEINRFLQRVTKTKLDAIYYVMPITYIRDFQTSLSYHVAYKQLKKIDLMECSIEEEMEGWGKWLQPNEIEEFAPLLTQLKTKKEKLKLWKVISHKNKEMSEYIVYNGEGLYRLHFRKEKHFRL